MRLPGSARRSSERERNLRLPERHIAIIGRSGYRTAKIWPFCQRGTPLRITRREFVVSTGALVVATALLGTELPAFADPTMEELMRAGPLPDIAIGKADAPVTVVEYASMTCPHCAAFTKTTFPELKTKYIDTGKVRFVFREFPLDELAVAASMLARCIDKDNGEKAMAVIEVLFNSQDKWAVRQPLPPLQQIAKQAGMTQQGFDECLANQKLYNDIIAMRERGSKEYKVESTPTLFVNGKMQKGGVSFEELDKLILPYLKS
jgi:protein-disulfide isomerase